MEFNHLINKFLFIYICISVLEITQEQFIIKINGNSQYLNYYYITLFLGETKENQTYLLDTTSSVTTSPCSFCTSCGEHINDYYQIKSNLSIIKSETMECISLPNILDNKLYPKYNDNDYCNFLLNFNDGAEINGFYAYNLIRFEQIKLKKNMTEDEDENEYISNKSEFYLPIGCSMNENGGFQTRIADGVFGLNNNVNSLISIMHNMNLTNKNIFSLCLDDDGGYLSLGDIDRKYHLYPDINYVNLSSNNDLYELEINKFFVGSFEINNKYISIIDTSSTISYFPKDLFNMILAGLFYECIDKDEECGKIKRIEGYGICAEFNNSNETNNAIYSSFPLIKIVFNDYEFNWKPKNYYLNSTSKVKYRVCLGIEIDENINNTIVLGTNFMHGYDIIFDKEENRIGFVEAECGRKMSKKINLINEIKKKEEEEEERNKKITTKNDEENTDNEKNQENQENLENQENEENEENQENQENEKIKENEENQENEKENKINENIDSNINNNYNKNSKFYFALLVIFVLFIIAIIIIIIDNRKEKNKLYTHLIINDKNKEENISNLKPLGQVIEMVDTNKEEN